MQPNSLLHRINGKLILTIDDVIAVLATIEHGHFFTIAYATLANVHESRFCEGRNDRCLTTMEVFNRDVFKDICAINYSETDSVYSPWTREQVEQSHRTVPPLVRGMSELLARQHKHASGGGSVLSVVERHRPFASVDLHEYNNAVVEVISEDSLHFAIDGTGVRDTMATMGIIIERSLGLVLTARSTVRSFMSNVTIVLAEIIRIPATVVYLHPCHNWAVVRFNVKLLDSSVRKHIVDVPLSCDIPRPGDSCEFVVPFASSGATAQVYDSEFGWPVPVMGVLDVGTSMYNRMFLNWLVPEQLTRGLVFHKERLAGFRCRQKSSGEQPDTSEEISLVYDWQVLRDVVQREAFGRPIQCRWLEVEMSLLDLSEARRLLRLSDRWLSALSEAHENTMLALGGSGDGGGMYGAVFIVHSMLQTDAGNKLQRGDIVLTVEDEVVHELHVIEKLVSDRPFVRMTVFRNEQEVDLVVQTERLDRYYHPMHVVEWCGCNMITTETTVRLLGRMPPSLLDTMNRKPRFASAKITSALAINEEPTGGGDTQVSVVDSEDDMVRGVFVSIVYTGSPTAVLEAGCWLLAINGISVLSLDDVLRVVTRIPNNSDVRVSIFSYVEAREKVVTFRTNDLFWPTAEFMLDEADNKWVRTEWTEPYGEELVFRSPTSLSTANAMSGSRDSFLSQSNLHHSTSNDRLAVPHIGCRPYHFTHYVYPTDEKWCSVWEEKVVSTVMRKYMHQTLPWLFPSNDVDSDDDDDDDDEDGGGGADDMGAFRIAWWNQEFLPTYLQPHVHAFVRSSVKWSLGVATVGIFGWKAYSYFRPSSSSSSNNNNSN